MKRWGRYALLARSPNFICPDASIKFTSSLRKAKEFVRQSSDGWKRSVYALPDKWRCPAKSWLKHRVALEKRKLRYETVQTLLADCIEKEGIKIYHVD